MLIYFVGIGYLATIRPFWFDELFTLYISQTQSLTQVLELLGPMDPHPPVQYVLVMISHQLFGVNELTTRLPALVMLGVFMTVCYALARKYLNNQSALFAVLLIILSVSLKYGYEARPYAIVIGFTALTYWYWIKARESKKVFPIILAGLFSGLTVLTHFYAVLGFLPLYLYQLISVAKKEKGAWPLLISIGLGSGLLLTTLPILQSITVLSKNNWAAPSLYDFLAAGLHFHWFIAILGIIGLWNFKALLISATDKIKSSKELQAVLLLVTLMLYGFLFSLISGAFHNRYVFATLLGSVTLGAMIFYYLNNTQKILTLLCSIVIGTYIYTAEIITSPAKEQHIIEKNLTTFESNVSGPVVFAHYLDYLLYYHYSNPQLRDRLIYLIDYSLDFKYEKISGDISLHKLKELKPDLNLQDLNTFLIANKSFHIVGNTSFSYHLDSLNLRYEHEYININGLTLNKIITSK